VELLIRKFAEGYTVKEITENYPHLGTEQIYAALNYAADIIANEEILEVA